MGRRRHAAWTARDATTALSKALAAVGGVQTGRALLRRTVRGIHSVSRFVESIVKRDLVHDDPTWRPALARIPDVVRRRPDLQAGRCLTADGRGNCQHHRGDEGGDGQSQGYDHGQANSAPEKGGFAAAGVWVTCRGDGVVRGPAITHLV
jgi:hypothetical protein